MLQDSGTPSLSSPLAFVCFSRAAACLSLEEHSHWVLEKRAPDPPTVGGSAGGDGRGGAVQESMTVPKDHIMQNNAKERA